MKSQDGIGQYAPWEQEEKKKKKQPKKRSIPAKTNQKASIRSKPKTRDQDYLDLYLKAREKERLESYGRTLGERQKAISQAWKEVKSTIHNKQRDLPPISEDGIEELLKDEKEKKRNRKEKKKHGNIQKMDWNY